MSGNPHRGDLSFAVDGRTYVLRPTFAAVVAAEQEIGSLLALAAQAQNGLSFEKAVALLHHCHLAADPAGPDREAFGAILMEHGFMPSLALFKQLMTDLLGGQGDGRD